MVQVTRLWCKASSRQSPSSSAQAAHWSLCLMTAAAVLTAIAGATDSATALESPGATQRLIDRIIQEEQDTKSAPDQAMVGGQRETEQVMNPNEVYFDNNDDDPEQRLDDLAPISIDYDGSADADPRLMLDAKRSNWAKFSGGWGKRSWNQMQGSWGKRPSAGLTVRSWNNLNGGWGKKRAKWNDLKGMWGRKRGDWSKMSSAWGKRGPGTWNKMSSAWGKRGSGTWNKMSSAWGKRKRSARPPAQRWNQLRGMWGKRLEQEQQSSVAEMVGSSNTSTPAIAIP